MKDRPGPRYKFDDFELDVQNRRLTARGESCPLEPKSFRLLQFLIENRDRTVLKDEIVASVWPDTFVSDNSITRAVTQIRKALNDDAKVPKYVETVPTVGYRFVGMCTEESPVSIPSSAAGIGSDRELPRGVDAGVLSAQRPLKLIFAVGALLALVIGTGFWRWRASRESADAHLLQVTRVSRLTSFSGDAREPAISPDGSYVAFSWSGGAGDNYDIYVIQAAGQQPLRLTQDPAPDSFPAWSPDGRQIAFIRHTGSVADIITISPLGGPERILHHFSRIGADLDFTQHPLLSWSRDGKSIVYSGQSYAGEKFRLFRLSVETGAVQPISTPSEAVTGDSSPAVSADEKYLAFVRYVGPRNGQLMIQPLGTGMVPGGEPTAITKTGLDFRSPIWLEDGRRLLFADSARLYQWEKNEGPVPIYAADAALGGLSLGPIRGDGSRQAVVAKEKWNPDIWVIPLNSEGKKSIAPPHLLIRSTTDDSHPEYSPDGRRIAFTSSRSGSGELWLSDADGRNPRQLSHLGASVLSYPKWSPDGKRIVFHARVPETAELYVVDPDAGVPIQITHENPGLAVATWSRDGRFIYASTLVGAAVSFKIPAGGGPPERLWDGDDILESVDGKFILYSKTKEAGIFRRSLAGDPVKNPEEVIVPDYWRIGQLGGYVPVAGGIYYVSGDAQGRPGPFRYFDYASRKSIDLAPAVRGLGRGFSVSPDRRSMAFPMSSDAGGELLSLELR